jgi:predicted acylesterase/phospholipase RssA
MVDQSVRENIGIAVDGGGIKGLIVAHGLIALEEMLGSSPLIDDPRVKVIAGTSTGALIAAGLAVGLTGEEILSLYQETGKQIFSKSGRVRPFGWNIPLLNLVRLPTPVLRFLVKSAGPLGDLLALALLPVQYSPDPLRDLVETILEKHPAPNSDPTLAELGEFLRQKPNDPRVIMTAVEVVARKTHFLKTSEDEQYGHMKLTDAILASSALPTGFPPVKLPEKDAAMERWLVDGGVGNFGNPAYVVAWELCDPLSQNPVSPGDVTLYSFGTGHVPVKVFRKAYGPVTRWWALDWAERAPDLFTDDAIREQSRRVVANYNGIDLRRFQVALAQAIDADGVSEIDKALREKGLEMRERVRNNQHALRQPYDPANDPEGIGHPIIFNLLDKP